MSTVTDALKNPKTRWKFSALALLIALVLFLLRYFFFPAQLAPNASVGENVTVRILETLATGLIAALLVQALALLFGKDEKSIALISILDRTIETTPAFEDAFLKTKKQWYFKGGFGSYFRKTTLPALIKKKNGKLDVMVVLVNINNDRLVESYAEYRKYASGDTKVDATVVRNEITSTIETLAKTLKANRGAFSNVRVAFVNSYSPFRIDFHDNGVILTHDSKTSPALKFSADSSYYFGYTQEMEQFKKKCS
jgi:hypothetical protein